MTVLRIFLLFTGNFVSCLVALVNYVKKGALRKLGIYFGQLK